MVPVEIDYIEKLELIRKRIDILRNGFDTVDFKDDIRFIVLNQFYRQIMCVDLSLIDVILTAKNRIEEHFKPENVFFANEIFQDYQKYQIRSVIFTICILFENYLRVIYEQIYPSAKANTSIYSIRKDVFSKFSICQSSDLWKSSIILFNIRNAFHNNGIFMGVGIKEKTITISYRGYDNIFEKNTPIKCASMHNLIFIIDDTINLIEVINKATSKCGHLLIPAPWSSEFHNSPCKKNC